MNALCHSGECRHALEVFRSMIKKKLEPGLVSCNYVLTFCSKHKQGMVAMEFLGVMKKVRFVVVVAFDGEKGRLWMDGWMDERRMWPLEAWLEWVIVSQNMVFVSACAVFQCRWVLLP